MIKASWTGILLWTVLGIIMLWANASAMFNTAGVALILIAALNVAIKVLVKDK